MSSSASSKSSNSSLSPTSDGASVGSVPQKESCVGVGVGDGLGEGVTSIWFGINLAKNELYARHGRKFKSKELQEYFESKDWYVPKYSPKQWDKKGDTFFFNKYEIKNRDLLKKYENK